MAITQVGVTTHSSTEDPATSLAISKPSGVAAGDVLIAAITANNSALGVPSGWTEFEGQTAPTVAWQCRLYYRVATGSEGSSFTWTVGSAAPSAGFIQAWRGVDNTTPIDGTADALSESNVAEPDTGPSATMSSSSGKLFYIRGARRTSAGGTAGAMSTADANASLHLSKSALSASGNTAYVIAIFSANAQYVTSGSKSGLAISYSSTEATHYEATFGLKEAVAPTTGDMTATLPAVTSTLAGQREPNTGTITGSLPAVQAALVGQHLIPAVGTMTASLPAVTSTLAGNTPVLATLSASITLTLEASGETRQFGEHIIRVEPDHRAFLVVDDGTDVGLKPIKRSRVTDA